MILYKYYPCNEYTYKSLAVNGLWCHIGEFMNDPFESLNPITYKFTSEDLRIYRKILQASPSERNRRLVNLGDDELGSLLNSFRTESIKRYAFCALSESPNEVLMWSHYADGHRGFVLGLEFPELEDDHHLTEVSYLDEIPAFDAEYEAKLFTGETDDLIPKFKSLSCKSKHWKYEKEWRIWRNSPCYYRYEPEQVKEIIFGVRTPDDVTLAVLNLMNYLPEDFEVKTMELKEAPLRLEY